MSGPKNDSARDSAAMRWPSRQITASEIAGASAPRGDGAREIGEHQAFGAVGDLRQRQRRAGRKQFGGRFRVCIFARRAGVNGNRAARRNNGVSYSAGTSAPPLTQAKICWSGTSSQRSNSSSSASLKRRNMRVGEAADDQIHLADAAMPGAEQQPPPPRVQSFARSSLPLNACLQRQKPGGAGCGFI